MLIVCLIHILTANSYNIHKHPFNFVSITKNISLITIIIRANKIEIFFQTAWIPNF